MIVSHFSVLSEQKMLCFVLVTLLAAASAQPWYSGACGISKYADAGAGCPVGGACGAIIGGTAARDNEFPWQVSLRYGGTHECGGMIINEQWVVSAAACTKDVNPADITVVVGGGSMSTPIPSEVVHTAVAVFEHELYEGSTFNNDITVIKLTNNITFSADVTAICASDPANLYESMEVQASGWGYTVAGGVLSDGLRYTSLMTLVNNQACIDAFPGNTITPEMICAGDGALNDARDTCEGDAGSPLQLKDATSGTFSAVGITSWGIGCAAGTPGVYTRFASHNAWITTKLDKN